MNHIYELEVFNNVSGMGHRIGFFRTFDGANDRVLEERVRAFSWVVEENCLVATFGDWEYILTKHPVEP
jgi:hypothetical protein